MYILAIFVQRAQSRFIVTEWRPLSAQTQRRMLEHNKMHTSEAASLPPLARALHDNVWLDFSSLSSLCWAWFHPSFDPSFMASASLEFRYMLLYDLGLSCLSESVCELYRLARERIRSCTNLVRYMWVNLSLLRAFLLIFLLSATRIMLAASVGLPASSLAINRRLYRIASIQSVAISLDDVSIFYGCPSINPF